VRELRAAISGLDRQRETLPDNARRFASQLKPV